VSSLGELAAFVIGIAGSRFVELGTLPRGWHEKQPPESLPASKTDSEKRSQLGLGLHVRVPTPDLISITSAA